MGDNGELWPPEALAALVPITRSTIMARSRAYQFLGKICMLTTGQPVKYFYSGVIDHDACISECFKSASFVVFRLLNSCIIIYCCLFTIVR